MISLGNIDIKKISLGSNKISKISLGDVKVFSSLQTWEKYNVIYEDKYNVTGLGTDTSPNWQSGGGYLKIDAEGNILVKPILWNQVKIGDYIIRDYIYNGKRHIYGEKLESVPTSSTGFYFGTELNFGSPKVLQISKKGTLITTVEAEEGTYPADGQHADGYWYVLVGWKMKILEYNEVGNRVLVSVIYDDNTFTTLNMVNTNDKESILRDVYIISNDVRNRQSFEGEIPVDLETWNPPTSVATTMTVDFYNLTGKAYDQYGEEMNVDVTFEIEGAGARIEDGVIIEDAVDNDTSYFVVAKVGELEERQERYLYAPVEPPVSEMEILETKLKASTDRQDFLEELIAEMAMMLY